MFETLRSELLALGTQLRAPAYREAVVIGCVVMVATIALSLDSPATDVDGVALFAGTLLVGYRYHDRTVSATDAGQTVGKITMLGVVPYWFVGNFVVLRSVWERSVLLGAGFTGLALLASLLSALLVVIVAGLCARAGSWLASKRIGPTAALVRS